MLHRPSRRLAGRGIPLLRRIAGSAGERRLAHFGIGALRRVGRGEETLAIAAEFNAVDPGRLSQRRADPLARARVPHLRRAVEGAGHDARPVGIERGARHPSPVPQRLADALPGARIPDLGGVVVGPGQDTAAVGIEARAEHHIVMLERPDERPSGVGVEDHRRPIGRGGDYARAVGTEAGAVDDLAVREVRHDQGWPMAVGEQHQQCGADVAVVGVKPGRLRQIGEGGFVRALLLLLQRRPVGRAGRLLPGRELALLGAQEEEAGKPGEREQRCRRRPGERQCSPLLTHLLGEQVLLRHAADGGREVGGKFGEPCITPVGALAIGGEVDPFRLARKRALERGRQGAWLTPAECIGGAVPGELTVGQCDQQGVGVFVGKPIRDLLVHPWRGRRFRRGEQDEKARIGERLLDRRPQARRCRQAGVVAEHP